MTHRATVIVRIYTTDGAFGEAYVGDEVDTLAAIVAVIKDELTPMIVGADARRHALVWERAWPVTKDILRDRRTGLVALAGVDTAIWDLVGRDLGTPLHRLWGGSSDRVRMIAIGGYYDSPVGPIEKELDDYRGLNLAGIKFKVGGRSPLEDAARVRRVREVAGDDFLIAVDANQGYSMADALAFCAATRDLGITWFEEPVGWANDRRELATVRRQGGIPVAAGQSELSTVGCRQLMEADAIDVCNFDASWSGGPTAWLRTAALAHSFGVQMAHHEEPQVAAHLIASQPHGTYVECFHPDRDPLWWHLVSNRPEIVDGYMTLPDGPGLGWELDREYIAFHRADR
jgi:L-alanine-DL-glutamate epimerase-like enolase superfamily enzyme